MDQGIRGISSLVNLELRVPVTISGKQGIRDGTAGYSMLDTRYLAGLAKINRLWGFCLSDLGGKIVSHWSIWQIKWFWK